MRFHVPALPGRPTVRENSSCAYTQKVRRFCEMMRDRGHQIFLYGGGRNDARASAYVACYPNSEPLAFDAKAWEGANLRAAAAISERKEEGDFVCVIGGQAQRAVADAHPDLIAVEYGVGYAGVFADFRVFESYAWMHVIYGHLFTEPMSDEGRFFDAVIPNYFDVDDFPFREKKEDYVLYVGRLIDKKGIGIAEEAARRAGVPLLIAGPGDRDPEYGELIGEVGLEERGELMAGAHAVLAPTLYVEPFGGVAVEAQLCGTPAITTDWGAFTETVEHGRTGYRCRTLEEFAWAINNADRLDAAAIRERAVANYSLEAIGPKYEAYFEQLATLWEGGWDSSWEGLSRTHRYGLVPHGVSPGRRG